MAGSLMLGNAYPHDMYLLALPLYAKSQIFTFIAFLGGLSAATAMVVVETVALSIMLCNDLLMPLILKRPAMAAAGQPDMSGFLLNIRRAVMLSIILAAYAFYDKIGKCFACRDRASFLRCHRPIRSGLFHRSFLAQGHGPGRGGGHSRWFCLLGVHASSSETDRRYRRRARRFSRMAHSASLFCARKCFST